MAMTLAAGRDLKRDPLIALVFGAAATGVYALSALGQVTPYDYFGRLAIAFAHGEYWLDGAPPHLNELVVGVGGHAYSVVPPLPALLLVPLVSFGSPAVIQQLLSVVAAGASIAPLFLAMRALRIRRDVAVWSAALAAFGTTLWISAADGRSWFAADAVSVLLVSIALLFAAQGRSPLLIGVFIGLAGLARLPALGAAPALLLLACRQSSRRCSVRDLVTMAAGVLPSLLLEAGYNVLRWGTPMEVGYSLLSAHDPYYAHGTWSLSYLPRHIYAIFYQAPAFVDDSVFFLRAPSIGMSLLFTTPAFAWLLRLPMTWRQWGWAGLLALACAAIVPDVLFGTVGFEQYGYRRSLDIQPFLVVLVAAAAGSPGEPRGRAFGIFGGLIVVSSLITLYFLVTLRLFGFAP